MPHLVSSLVSQNFRHVQSGDRFSFFVEDVRSELAGVFIALGNQYLDQTTSLSAGKFDDWRKLAASITPKRVMVDALPPFVSGGEWDRVEMLNQLRHMEVLLKAMDALDGFRFHYCAPTQQSDVGTSGLRFADLEGVDPNGVEFALEAYGGNDYRTNRKAGKDMRSLRVRGAPRSFMAARADAWPACWFAKTPNKVVNDKEQAEVVGRLGDCVVEVRHRP